MPTTAISSAVFSPPIDEGRWISQGPRTLDSEHIIEIDFTPTIFQVPQSLKETAPEAYTPRLLGLGPYHHLRPDLHSSHTQKLTMIKKFQKNSQQLLKTPFFSSKKMKDIEPVVRSHYDKYLDLEGETLEYITHLDSFFLIDFLGAYDKNTDAANLEPFRKALAKDVIMMENQIPAIALEEMGKELELFSPVKSAKDVNMMENEVPAIAPAKKMKGRLPTLIPLEESVTENMLYSQLFYYFCKAHSPLEVSSLWDNIRGKSAHLLEHMYYLVLHVNPYKLEGIFAKESVIIDAGTELLTALNELGLGGPLIKPLLFGFKAIQVIENSTLAKEIVSGRRNKEQEANIKATQKAGAVISHICLPSASELSEKHGVDFRVLEGVGIMGIRLDVEEAKKPALYLPPIHFKYDSDVVLRNLVAYEAAVATTKETTLELAEYVVLMANLLQTPKDVAMLRERGIIMGNVLGDGEVVEIFNGIEKCVGKSERVSASKEVKNQVKAMVEEWEKKKGKTWKRVQRSVEKEIKYAIEVMRKPCVLGMKYLLYIFLALLVVLQIMQAYCDVYGCRKDSFNPKEHSQFF
ncbi:unnamed protein product [Cuscuta epithymum]|uniref:Uncharacterized protein n=1 Tax=Cuscuta epithymum TaxID=186058 RepID=A0AAV0F2R7_9ASTE|nr:unnamed protein product [Cuscuta epithymum]